MLVIWNACYLECLVFGILPYSTSFTMFHRFHSLPIYYRVSSVLRTINHFSFHPRTFNSSTNIERACLFQGLLLPFSMPFGHSSPAVGDCEFQPSSCPTPFPIPPLLL